MKKHSTHVVKCRNINNITVDFHCEVKQTSKRENELNKVTRQNICNYLIGIVYVLIEISILFSYAICSAYRMIVIRLLLFLCALRKWFGNFQFELHIDN